LIISSFIERLGLAKEMAAAPGRLGMYTLKSQFTIDVDKTLKTNKNIQEIIRGLHIADFKGTKPCTSA